MDIVFCIDNNFAQHCGVTIVSICENNKDENIYFHIITDSLIDKNRQILEKIVAGYRKNIKIYDIDASIFKNCPIRKGDHVSLATYFRILIPVILPETVEKALYLDSDIVVRKNLIDLWQIDISNCPLGAVYDMCVDDIRVYNRLGLDVCQRYYNAGVLLMNLYYWRKHKISEKCFTFVNSKSDLLKWHDQDLLNILLGKEIKALPFTYNMQDTFFRKAPMLQQKYLDEIHECLDNPVIIHYSTSAKPWFKEISHPFKKDYYYYLSFTPWKKYKPRFRNRKTRIKYYLNKIYQQIL